MGPISQEISSHSRGNFSCSPQDINKDIGLKQISRVTNVLGKEQGSHNKLCLGQFNLNHNNKDHPLRLWLVLMKEELDALNVEKLDTWLEIV